MDRIDPLDSAYYSYKRSERKKSKKRTKTGYRLYSTVESIRERRLFLEELDEQAHGNNLEELLDEVHSTGDGLKSSQTLGNIKRYRRAVRNFLSFVVDKMLLVEEKVSGMNILKRKRFTQISVIDQRLERLVTDIMRNQYEQLDILQRIDEINGLLIDLLT